MQPEGVEQAMSKACPVQMMGKEKPIWRLAFFSRLEERKGIKLFVEAVSALNVTDEKFEVTHKTPPVILCVSFHEREQKLQDNHAAHDLSINA